MSGEITNLDDGVDSLPSIKMKPAGSEFVSGSGQFQNTQVRNYKALTSTGNFQSQVVQTSPSGYKLFSSFQGVVASEEVQ